MIITHKGEFFKGVVLAVTFLIVLAIMFMPYFGTEGNRGLNALEAADKLFNSISKGSTNYFAGLAKKVQSIQDKTFDLTIKLKSEDLAKRATTLLQKANVSVKTDGAQLNMTGKFGDLLTTALADSEVLFRNQSEELGKKYGFSGPTGYTRKGTHTGDREASSGELVGYVWSSVLYAMDKPLKDKHQFAEATIISEVMKKGVDVAYNFYGIEAETIGTKVGILSFALIFYVLYTIWWGVAILFLCEGIGLQMKAGAKKEV